jgi:hypothetical protein
MWDYFVTECPIQLIENIAPSVGLANGTLGKFVRPVYEKKEDLERAKVALAQIGLAEIELPTPKYIIISVDVPHDMVCPQSMATTPSSTSPNLKTIFVPVSRCSPKKGCVDSKVHLPFSRLLVEASYFPARVAFSLTIYKVQGATLTGGVLVRLDDITRDCLAMLYVAASRVREGRLLRFVSRNPTKTKQRFLRAQWDSAVAQFDRRCVSL